MEILRLDDPSIAAVPIYILAMVLEWAFLRSRGSASYETNDTASSIGTGLASLLTVGLASLGAGFIAQSLIEFRPWVLEGWWSWLVGLLSWDFVYYWVHRFEHEVRIGWASHVGHHSSRRFNFSTALRQPLLPWPALLAFPFLVLTGVPPEVLAACGGWNLLYQFFVHTQAVGRLPRAVEWIFNTPSHHRVHHGSNPKYLDRNHGGILIVWDRLFGTFQEEDEPVVYGLTDGVERHGIWEVFAHEYRSIGRELAAGKGWRALFGPPGGV